MKKYLNLWFLLTVLTVALTGCGGLSLGGESLTVMVNTGSAEYLTTAASSNFVDADGNRQTFNVNLIVADAGEAIVRLQEGEQVDLWIPDQTVWANIASDQGVSGFEDCVSVAETPLVIGMWDGLADSLGYPARSLGWLDVGSLAADSESWRYYSGGEYGESLRLGHTHPGLSASGASTLLALVHSAEGKATAVTPDDISQPIVQASVGAFEGAVSWFSKNTMELGETMQVRGTNFLGAGIMYESTVLNEGNGAITPVYPFEGTFMATNPACVNNSGNTEAAEAFRDALLSENGQLIAASNGLRPVNGTGETEATLAIQGVSLDTPINIFAEPSVASVYAVQELWQSARKPVHLVMLLDTSGSMRGDKIAGMRESAEQFTSQMGDNDFLTLIEFNTRPIALSEYVNVGENRSSLQSTIRNLRAGGDTALYDSIGAGAELIERNNSGTVSNALVVLTDGEDTSSVYNQFNETLAADARSNDTIVFTIAYGRDAEERLLESLALEANGQFFLGDEANIGEIYEEMSAAFGGSVGIGR